jgi:hypothetical protein
MKKSLYETYEIKCLNVNVLYYILNLFCSLKIACLWTKYVVCSSVSKENSCAGLKDVSIITQDN